MEIENKGMELHVRVTAEDVDQAVKDWFASRGFVASPRKWVKMSERKPGRNWLFLVSMLERKNNVRWVIPAQWNATSEAWESIQTGAQFHEDEMERVQAWMELPEPYREPEE